MFGPLEPSPGKGRRLLGIASPPVAAAVAPPVWRGGAAAGDDHGRAEAAEHHAERPAAADQAGQVEVQPAVVVVVHATRSHGIWRMLSYLSCAASPRERRS